MSLLRRRMFAALIATFVFCVAACAVLFLLPYVLGLFYGCFPPTGSCGDSVGWALLISAPLTILFTVLLAGGLAAAAYLRATRSKISK